MNQVNSSEEGRVSAQAVGPRVRMPGVVYPPTDALQRYAAAGMVGQTTLAEAFMAAHAAHADKPALVGPEGSFTHGQLDAITDRIAAGFLALGLQPLDRVLLQLPNCNEVVFTVLACFKAGLIPVCSLVSHREREIGFLARHAEARLHVVPGDDPKFDHVEFSHRIRAETPSLRHTVVARGPARDGALSLADLRDGQDPEVARQKVLEIPRDPYQVGVFQLSGGTSGVPKIIPRFSGEYVYNMRAMAAWLEYRAGDCWYNPMPIAHNFNMVCCAGPVLLSGGAIAVMATMEIEALTHLLSNFQPTWMALPGPVLAKLKPMLASGEISFRRARGIVSSNSSELIEEITGVSTFHNFGMTEGVILSTHPDDPVEARRRTVGRPISALDEVRILHPGTEEVVPDGSVGEAAFRGPYTTHGYYDAAERNAEAFTSDGFYRSGDLMARRIIDGKAYYSYEGRIKDVVDRGGEKINAEEVEVGVISHAAVAACAVIGVKDKIYGERLCACITLRPGFEAPDVKQMGLHLQKYGLAKFKWPERIEVLNTLPLTHVGKLDKVKLREMFATPAAGGSS